jgi:hypothetical protein
MTANMATTLQNWGLKYFFNLKKIKKLKIVFKKKH